MTQTKASMAPCYCCGDRLAMTGRRICAACQGSNCAPWNQCSVPIGYSDEGSPRG